VNKRKHNQNTIVLISAKCEKHDLQNTNIKQLTSLTANKRNQIHQELHV